MNQLFNSIQQASKSWFSLKGYWSMYVLSYIKNINNGHNDNSINFPTKHYKPNISWVYYKAIPLFLFFLLLFWVDFLIKRLCDFLNRKWVTAWAVKRVSILLRNSFYLMNAKYHDAFVFNYVSCWKLQFHFLTEQRWAQKNIRQEKKRHKLFLHNNNNNTLRAWKWIDILMMIIIRLTFTVTVFLYVACGCCCVTLFISLQIKSIKAIIMTFWKLLDAWFHFRGVVIHGI